MKIRGDIRNFVFIAGVISCSPVQATPAINYFRCRCYRRLRLVPDFHRFHDTGNEFIAVINDTGFKKSEYPLSVTVQVEGFFDPGKGKVRLW
jgi:hypothetical protein